MTNYEITINGKRHTFAGRVHSYEEIVAFAFADPADPQPSEDAVLTVTYAKACHGKQGTLTPGQTVEIVAGTVFNVADTGNA